MIYAISPEGVIGLGGQIPWHHPADQRRFQRITRGCAVIMGRATFDENGVALAERRNLVVTSRPLPVPGVETAPSLAEALARVGDADVWLIGGARIFAEGAFVADLIDVTYVPDHVLDQRAVHAPPIDASRFDAGPLLPHEDDPSLSRRVYRRRPVAG